LNDSAHSVDINGFKFLHKYRQNRTGGGVGLYISNDLEFKLREDLSLHNVDTVESLFIELIRPREKNIIVENKICFLMGDFNINLINYQNHHLTGQFLDGMYSNMFFPLITRPSRITSHTATLID
ncbi:unnamed protein product, partial [Porites evermanni]